MYSSFLKIGLAAVLVLLFCGAAVGAVGATDIADVDALKTALGNATVSGNTVQLTNNCTLSDELIIKTDGITLDLNGYVISAPSSKRAFTIDSGVTFTLTDSPSDHSHNFVMHPGAVWTRGDDSQTAGYTLEEIIANPTLIAENKSVSIPGGCITGGSANDGGGVYVQGTFIMGSETQSGGNIVGNTSTSDDGYGGGVYVHDTGSFTLNNGNIVGNKSSATGWGGGGVFIYSPDSSSAGGSFTMNGGSIAGNYANHDGGGVFVGWKGTGGSMFTMTGGTIIGNSAGRDAGGVCVWSGNSKFEMTGGSITGNKATGNGGGVYANAGTTFKVSGTPVIKDNKKGDADNNLYLCGVASSVPAALFTVTGALGPGADIRIANPGAVEDTFATYADGVTSTDDYKYFYPDKLGTGDAAVKASYSDTEGKHLEWESTTTGWWNGAADDAVFTPASAGYTTADGFKTAITYGRTGTDPHAGAASCPENNTVKLNKDVKLGGTLIIGSNDLDHPVTLNLGGKVLSRDSSAANFSVITVENGKYLTLDDNSADVHYFQVSDGETLKNRWEYIPLSGSQTKPADANDTNTIALSAITSYDNDAAGGWAYRASSTSPYTYKYVTVTGGCITGGTGTSDGTHYIGGGVYVSGTFTLSDGNIIGNSALFSGGGVRVASGTFTMNGGSIAGNSTSNTNGEGYGGGVNSGSTFTMEGGLIVGNYARANGGGVSADGGTFTMMNNAGIIGNSATGSQPYGHGGGGVYVNVSPVTFNMSGGKISGNKVTGTADDETGGGVYVTNTGTFNVSGTPVIVDNKKGTNENNVYLPTNKTITLIDPYLSDAAKIGVTSASTADSIPVTPASYSTDYSAFFTSDSASYIIKNTGSGSTQGVSLVKATYVAQIGETKYSTVQAAVDAVPDNTETTITMIANSTEPMVTIPVGKTIILNLNGWVLAHEGDSGSVISISGPSGEGETDAGNLEVIDNVDGTTGCNAQHYFKYAKEEERYKAWEYVVETPVSSDSVAIFKLNGNEDDKFTREAADEALTGGKTVYIEVIGGCITGGTGGISDNGTLTLTGGNIIGNSNSGVHTNGTTSSMKTGSVIAGNTADLGGGVYVGMKGNFTMEGGQIIYNSIIPHGGNGQGGGVFVDGAEDKEQSACGCFTMEGGEIAYNYAHGVAGASTPAKMALGSGGGVCPDANATFIMDDGNIHDNVAEGLGGGGIGVWGYAEIHGGTITGNSAPVGGGVGSIGSLLIDGGEITGNTASLGGGVSGV